MKAILILHVLAASWILSTAWAQAVAENADAKLESFFKNYLEESFRQRPVDATRLGDHRFDGLLDDLSPRARAAWGEQAQRPSRNYRAGGVEEVVP